MALRPNVMYGEGDPYYVTNGLLDANKNDGVLARVGDGSAKFQQAYVGNMAWAHVVAMEAMAQNPDVGGHVFFVTDDTPVMNSFEFMEPFLNGRGMILSDFCIPYKPLYFLLTAAEKVLWLMSPFAKVNLPIQACSVLYVSKSIYFNRKKAELYLKYKPLYPPEDALELSMRYYKNIALTQEMP